MKKFIAYILMLAMCLTLFVGCAEAPADNTSEAASDLSNAIATLNNLYKGDGTKDTPSKMAGDTDVTTVVVVAGVSYSVEWSVDVTSGAAEAVQVAESSKENYVKIDVTAQPEDVTFTLKATVKDASGNSESISFSYYVPATTAASAAIANGTYVISTNGLSFAALDATYSYGYANANAVTISDGTVSGHSGVDVVTITNVDGGVTIQDIYGRYMYLKGSYNSFNVDTTAPEEGHIWEIKLDGDNYILVNTMNQKTIAYSTTYSSWGAYLDLTDDHSSALSITAATAPAGDSTGDGSGSSNDSGSSNNSGSSSDSGSSNDSGSSSDSGSSNDSGSSDSTNAVTNPSVGVAYKLAVYQGNLSKTLYFAGTTANTDYYMTTTETASEAVDVYLEEVSGGYRLYFMDGSTKTYLDIYLNGTYYNARLTTSPTAVYTWDSEYNTLVADIDGTPCYLGAYNTYSTISASKYSYLSGSSSFCCCLYSN